MDPKDDQTIWISPPTTRMVVTYNLAYSPDKVSLSRKGRRIWEAEERPALGSVCYGTHRGQCAVLDAPRPLNPDGSLGAPGQTLKRALYLARSGQDRELTLAAGALVGCPVGNWGETTQAMQRLREYLPLRQLREYSVDDFIEAAYVVDHADRYRPRPDRGGQ